MNKIKLIGTIDVTHGALRELILSRGWEVNTDSIGTVWMSLYKHAYDFISSIESSLQKRLKKIEVANRNRKWTRDWVNVSHKVQWTEDVTIVFYSLLYNCNNSHGMPTMSGMRVKIKGNNRTYKIDIKNAVDTYINRELEKTLK